MSARQSTFSNASLADQLRSVKNALEQDGAVVENQSASVLVFPPLMSAEEIQVPGDLPSPVAEISPPQLRSNNDHWVEFEKLIELGDYAAAATVVEYLDVDANLKASLTGLYVKAQIVIRRGRIEFAQAQSLVDKAAEAQHLATERAAAQRHAESVERDLRRLETARKRSTGYLLGRAFASIKENHLAGPAFATIFMLGMTVFYR